MNIKTKRLIAAILIVAGLPAAGFAQETTRENYIERYNNLVSRVGAAGLGVESLLNRWEADYPDDVEMLLGRFSYYLSKSQSSGVEVLDQEKYLGASPVLTLKDSLGNNVNYFSVTSYDDELFGKAVKAVDRACELFPERLDLRLYRISALIGYEQGSPDMALDAIRSLIDYNNRSKPAWEYPGLEIDAEVFSSSIQEYCYAIYNMGTPAGYEAFREISELMLSYNPEDYVFLTNLGSYHFVVKHDNKTAMKYYNKVLKKHPDDYPTIRNCVILARTAKDAKLEKKYLPMLVEVSPDETERASARARMEAL
ncbi:MAG: hypothetical protein ACI399_07230 [Candidatus Cryptobacteroides sp.]